MTAAVAHSAVDVVPTGLPFGTVRWGAHLCHFFQTATDLEEVTVPFFLAGLRNREQCVWVVQSPLTVEQARQALARAAGEIEPWIRDGQLAIVEPTAAIDWVERERLAIADGFAGLRIAGEVAVQSADWRELAMHENRFHHALHGRRITALCSYHLDRCGPQEIIDVLRNHKSALLRRDRMWEPVESATAALALVAPAVASASKAHTVEFFAADDFPASSMARRLSDALAKQQAALALCTREHLADVLAAITRRIDPADALAAGRLLLLDADSVHAELSAAPDFEAALDAKLGIPVRELARKFGRVRAYGELVDVYCREGRRDLAVLLERWWNRLIHELPVELHCGYTVAAFDDADSIHDFRQVCDEHGYVFARQQIGATDPDRLAAELQQVSSILETESARRAAAETAATVSREHLVVLQRITSALGEAVTFEDIGRVVTGEVGPAVGATRSAIVIDGQLVALRGITTPDDTSVIASALDFAPAQWSQRGALAADIAWVGGALCAVLPLMFAEGRIGTLLLGFDRADVSVANRALADDLARQVALAVERARVYEQAHAERTRAERANAAKDHFLAMLGHELRNPLSPILSATQLMRLRSPDLLVDERMTIERSVTHMIRLVDSLLDVAEISRGDVALAREPSDLGELVHQALEVARTVIDERVRFAVEIAPQLVVDVDRSRMRQVIANLVINAAKHTDHGSVEITGRALGESVELAVRDHGTGIERELLPHVFDLFVQGKQAHDRARGGLGVGLAIARSIVELHGGTIAAASDGPGHGSTFTIQLPRWQTERTTDQIAVPAVAGSRRVLVVDDNEDAAWLLAEALQLLGHEVKIAHDGPSALEVARAWTPEVALLDIGLPGMNGFDLCRALSTLPTRPYAIAVSGYGQPKDRQEARDAGFDAHFVKPVDLRDVQAAIDALADS